MKNSEIRALVQVYFNHEGYEFPHNFEHRFDPDSSAILYSLIRRHQPKRCLHIGTWQGGSACITVSALEKNGYKYMYVASELLDDKREEAQQHVFEKTGVVPTMIGDITKNEVLIPNDLDFLFVDTDHDLETTKWIVDNVFPKLQNNALVVFHDWAVQDVDGKLVGKGDGGKGGWPETDYIMGLLEQGLLPLETLYWTYGRSAWGGMSPDRETAFWLWKKE